MWLVSRYVSQLGFCQRMLKNENLRDMSPQNCAQNGGVLKGRKKASRRETVVNNARMDCSLFSSYCLRFSGALRATVRGAEKKKQTLQNTLLDDRFPARRQKVDRHWRWFTRSALQGNNQVEPTICIWGSVRPFLGSFKSKRALNNKLTHHDVAS